MKSSLSMLAVGIVFVFSFVFASNLFASDFKYVGNKICMACHKSEKGKFTYEKWTKTAHANAFETLKNEKSKEIAKKKGLKVDPTEAEECLKCHAVGYFKGEVRLASAKKEEGVGCEACHGPASEYKTKHGKGKEEEGIKNGLVLGKDDEKICTKCHNPESPTYKKFDYKKFWEAVKH